MCNRIHNTIFTYSYLYLLLFAYCNFFSMITEYDTILKYSLRIYYSWTWYNTTIRWPNCSIRIIVHYLFIVYNPFIYTIVDMNIVVGVVQGLIEMLKILYVCNSHYNNNSKCLLSTQMIIVIIINIVIIIKYNV